MECKGTIHRDEANGVGPGSTTDHEKRLQTNFAKLRRSRLIAAGDWDSFRIWDAEKGLADLFFPQQLNFAVGWLDSGQVQCHWQSEESLGWNATGSGTACGPWRKYLRCAFCGNYLSSRTWGKKNYSWFVTSLPPDWGIVGDL